MNRKHLLPIIIFVLLLLTMIGVPTWVTIDNTEKIEEIVSKFEEYEEAGLKKEKSLQEVIALNIKNKTKSLLWNNLISSVAPIGTGLIALITVMLGFRRYLDERKRERLESAAVELKGILEQTVDADARVRTIGIVGLQHFFTPDKEEYHLRALSSLMAAARLETDLEVFRSIRIAAEKAIEVLPEKTLRQVSWRGVKLKGVDFKNCKKLDALDFRDAILEDAILEGCHLQGTDFTAANLKGVNFNKAIMEDANLTYADLAGASFVGANLKKANFSESMILDMDLTNADLSDAVLKVENMDWPMIKGWRQATIDKNIYQELIAKYGSDPEGIRVLMLMWEIPPLIAGGSWTACYHWVRNMRKLNVQMTVVVPWDNRYLSANPFGTDVELVSMGIRMPRPSHSPYSQAGPHSPYGPAMGLYGGYYSSYGSSFYHGSGFGGFGSPYSSSGHMYSPYGYTPSYSSYSEVSRGYSPYSSSIGGSSILRIANKYARRLERYVKDNHFDIIHAHDWVTFEAAEKAADAISSPWVAHFHSTEKDRRIITRDKVISRIERRAVNKASHIVSPSKITAATIQNEYNINSYDICVIPNVLSEQNIDPDEMGQFETRRSVFLGRLARQKGPDIFASVARRVRSNHRDYSFWIWGNGEIFWPHYQYQYDVHLMGALEWDFRFEAFDGASAVIMPSRSEPFGMVVLEAMQHRVPILYPANSGVAEVIKTDLLVEPENQYQIVTKLENLLGDWDYWEDCIEKQLSELDRFYNRKDEEKLLKLWKQLIPKYSKEAAKQIPLKR